MISTIIFDLGGVLIDWNPKYLFNKIFKEEAEAEHFLNTICTLAWNEEQDAGRSIKEATETLIKDYPDHEENIRAYYTRWTEMLGGPIAGTIDVFEKLKKTGRYKVYALTNWSSELFDIALQRYTFLQWFDGIVVSGTEKTRKPFPEFYNILLDRYKVSAAEALFIDDNKRNVEAAIQMKIDSIHFIAPEMLVEEFKKRNIYLD